MANEGGIRFGEAKATLAKVVDNGLCADDPRVMVRTNEAIKALMDEGIWVNGMAIFDIVGILSPSQSTLPGTQLWLPRELENAIDVEVLTSSGGKVRNQTDVAQGWYNLVNQFTYVDPQYARDNPLVDLFLYPDSGNVLRRLYDYPGLKPGSVVRVTGAKRFQPITDDDAFLLVQNVRAIKLMILAIEREENNKVDEAEKYRAAAVELLQKEVKKHQLDPMSHMRRKANYQRDLVQYATGTFANYRARLALEIPGYLDKGKADISYCINRALEALIRRENFFRIVNKWDIHGEPTEISIDSLPITNETLFPSEVCAGSLAAGDYDIIKRMCLFFQHSEMPVPQGAPVQPNVQEPEVYTLLEARLATALEFKRHTQYETTLSTAAPATMAATAAQLALDLPNGLKMSQLEVLRMANTAEQRLMERGKWKGTITTCNAPVDSGYVLFPRDVEAVLAASMDGSPVRIRSRYFEFHENTTGLLDCEVNASLLVDQGEEYNAASGAPRRRYKVLAACEDGTILRTIVKKRFVTKRPEDTMVIQNYEAIRYACLSMSNEADMNKSQAYFGQAIEILQKELQEHLAGIAQHLQVAVKGMRRIQALR